MKGKAKLILNWLVGALLVLTFFYGAVSWLWRASEESAATSLRSQVLSVLSGDLAEGNLFKLGATLTKLRQEGQIRFAEIRQIHDGKSQSIYKTAGIDEGVESAFSMFSCDGGFRLVRVSNGGVGLVTTLPALLAGADCTAAFISSDLPADLKKLKAQITVAFGVLIVLVMSLILLLTISWHKKVVILEVLAKTAVAEKEAAIGRMAAQVAHDIRSPLAALNAALHDLSALPGDRQELARGAMGRIGEIARDLLDNYKKPGAALTSEKPASPQDLKCLIDPVIAEKRAQYAFKSGITIEFSAAAGNAKAVVQPAEFRRIISNLVNNAVEAFESGGRVTIELAKAGDKILLKIGDTGKGIPVAILAKLGQKGETHGKAGGTGLGLYHARTSVENWGGKLDIHSVVGKGTTVTIELRAIDSAPPSASPYMQGAGRLTILVDDDALVRMNWKTAAKVNGISLKIYSNPKEFLAETGQLPKDVSIYLDSDLGDGVKGEEIAKDLHEKGFTDITLETGHPPEQFAHLPRLKVTGKEPPWRTGE